jgi:hypothetical protein
LNVPVTELYYITGGGAPISLQSSKWSQKHGGFSRLLTPEWRHWSQILVVITTGQPRSSDSDDNFTPVVFEKAWNSAESLYKKCRVLHGFMMPQFFNKKTHFFLPVRCIIKMLHLYYKINTVFFKKNWIRNLQI